METESPTADLIPEANHSSSIVEACPNTAETRLANLRRPAWLRIKPLLNSDRHAVLLLAAVFCLVYAYFFQGGGWNQNSHFDTVRSFVERHAADITPIAQNTGDVAKHDGRVYANKGPAFALVAVPVYFVLYHVERLSGWTVDSIRRTNLNAHILTFVASGLPGVALVLLLYLHFRRSSGTIRESLTLAGGFGAGTLVFPYTGVMMSHVFTASVLFASWYIICRTSARRGPLVLAGVLMGTAVVTDVLATPVALLFLLYVVRKHSPRALLAFVGGAASMATLFLAYNLVCFGNPWTTNQTLKTEHFQEAGLLLGMLDRPDLRRLYWLTFHPFRGLFYCCPILLIPLLSWPHWHWRAVTLEHVIPLAVIATYVLFILSFNGWAGGYGVGPRYLIPMLPFLFAFALPGFRRWPLPSTLLIALSTVLMFSVTAVQLVVRAQNGGVPADSDPVGDSVRELKLGRVSTSTQGMLDYFPSYSPTAVWASYNVGELVGLRGAASVVPAALLLAGLAAISVTLPRRRLWLASRVRSRGIAMRTGSLTRARRLRYVFERARGSTR